MFAIKLRPLVTWWPITLAAAVPLDTSAQGVVNPSTLNAPAPANPESPPPNGQAPVTPAETPAVVVNGKSAQTLLGKPVISLKSEALGRIVDVIVDSTGQMRGVIIDFGGFLGVGTRKIAVDWSILHFPPDGDVTKLIADLPRDQLQSAPIFKEGEPIVIMGRMSSTLPAVAPANAPVSSPVVPASPPPDSSATPLTSEH